jgi:hypothetical protein
MNATAQALRTDAVSQVSLPDEARALSSLPRIDYADAFLVDAVVERTPEQWVRAMLEDPPVAVRARLFAGWLALGLMLGPPWSGRRVLGWRVLRSEPDHVLLAAQSWLGLRGELLFRREPGGVLMATLIQLRGPAARTVWARIIPTHVRVVRSMLVHAAEREMRK